MNIRQENFGCFTVQVDMESWKVYTWVADNIQDWITDCDIWIDSDISTSIDVSEQLVSVSIDWKMVCDIGCEVESIHLFYDYEMLSIQRFLVDCIIAYKVECWLIEPIEVESEGIVDSYVDNISAAWRDALTRLASK